MNPEILASPSNNEAPARRFLAGVFEIAPETRTRLACLLIVLIAFGMRVYRLGDVELSGDEGFTYTLASRDYPSMLSEIIRLGEPQPAGSFLLEKAWHDLGGRSEFNLRMLNVCFGVIAVALAFALALKLSRSRAAALVAAILVATNPFGLVHSREYRTYAMVACLGLACLAAFLAYARSPSRVRFFALVACEWAVIQAHYVAVFLVASLSVAVGIWWLCFRLPRAQSTWPRPPGLTRWLQAQILVLALTLPWLILVRGTANTYGGTGSGNMPFVELVSAELARFTGAYVLTEFYSELVLLGVIAAAIGALALWRSSDHGKPGVITLCVCFGVPLLSVWAVSWIRPIFHPRYLIVIWPIYAILVASGVSAFARARAPGPWPRRGLRIGASAAVLCLAAASLVSGVRYLANLNLFNQWLPLVTGFKMRNGELPPSAIQLTVPWPDPAFGYYYQGDNVTVLPGPDRTQAGVTAQLQGFATNRVRRVLTHATLDTWWDRTNLAIRFEPAPYSKVETYYFEGRRFDRYELVLADRLTPLDIAFANGVQVRGVEVLTDTRWSALGLEIAFGGEAQLKGTEKMFLHVIDPAVPGWIVAQVDSTFPAQHLTVAAILRGMPLPDNLARRSYDIWIGLYDPTLPGAQRIPTTKGDDRALLATVVLGR